MPYSPGVFDECFDCQDVVPMVKTGPGQLMTAEQERAAKEIAVRYSRLSHHGATPIDDYKTNAVDMVNHPSHYNQGKIEAWTYIEDQKFGFLAGTILKYLARYRHKGSRVEDLRKMRSYLDELIAREGYDFGESKN